MPLRPFPAWRRRSTATTRPPHAARTDEIWRREVQPDEALLFRYSALTFNGRRVYYDRRYSIETGRYPGLVAHGPLFATLLAHLVRRYDQRALAAFEFRAMRPLFDIAPFAVCGAPTETVDSAELWAWSADGALAMEA